MKTLLDQQVANTTRPVAARLGGSWSKNLAGPRSDLDITIFYTRPRSQILNLEPDLMTFFTGPLELQEQGPNKSFYEFEGREVEVATTPVINSVSERTGSLIGGLAAMKSNVLLDFLRGIPIWATRDLDLVSWWTKLERFVMTELALDPDSLFTFFSGYLTSQLETHKRHRDFERRVAQSMADNRPDPIVKMMLEGVTIGLTGIALLRSERIYQDFHLLLQDHQGVFDLAQLDFISVLVDRKTSGRPVGEVSSFVHSVKEHRPGLLNTLKEGLNQALNETCLKSFDAELKHNNLLGFEALLEQVLDLELESH